jgi:hypothetical protein
MASTQGPKSTMGAQGGAEIDIGHRRCGVAGRGVDGVGAETLLRLPLLQTESFTPRADALERLAVLAAARPVERSVAFGQTGVVIASPTAHHGLSLVEQMYLLVVLLQSASLNVRLLTSLALPMPNQQFAE